MRHLYRRLNHTIPSSRVVMCAVLTLSLAACPFTLEAQQPPPPRPEPGQSDNIRELNRGPVHEAFAQPYQMSNRDSFVVDEQPPPPVNEIPPSQVPQGNDYQWIPGYWGWEPDEQRYIWISGVWRRAPEEMRWNPGYWANVDDGYAWVSGCWVRGNEMYMISQTPPDPRREASGRAPSPDHFWVPGHWDYSRGEFSWRAGFWSRGYDGRVWIPSRYIWTPRGYLAAEGYWDYELQNRGVLYCPVVFREPVGRNFRYSPTVVASLNHLPTHLFVYNDYGHYCFGDYYNTRVRRGTLIPWVQRDLGFYDPLQIFFRTQYRDRFDRYHQRHNYFRDHERFRPRHTWRDQRQFRDRYRGRDIEDAFLSAGINSLLDGADLGVRVRFDQDRNQWNRYLDRSRQFRDMQQNREQVLGDFQDRGRPQKRETFKIGPLQLNVNPDTIPGQADRDQRGRGNSGNRDRGRPDLEQRLPDDSDRRGRPDMKRGRPQDSDALKKLQEQSERLRDEVNENSRKGLDRSPEDMKKELDRNRKGLNPQPDVKPGQRPQPQKPSRRQGPDKPKREIKKPVDHGQPSQGKSQKPVKSKGPAKSKGPKPGKGPK